MKRRDDDPLVRTLLDSLHPYPGMRFLLFAREWQEWETTLLEYCRANDYEILLYRMPHGSDGAIPRSPLLSMRPYNPEQPRYNLQGRLYNHAFVTAPPFEAHTAFARRVYTGLANGGSIYLRLDEALLDTWESALEEGNYVALSRIRLNARTQILHGRKMHGWGN